MERKGKKKSLQGTKSDFIVSHCLVGLKVLIRCVMFLSPQRDAIKQCENLVP